MLPPVPHCIGKRRDECLSRDPRRHLGAVRGLPAVRPVRGRHCPGSCCDLVDLASYADRERTAEARRVLAARRVVHIALGRSEVGVAGLDLDDGDKVRRRPRGGRRRCGVGRRRRAAVGQRDRARQRSGATARLGLASDPRPFPGTAAPLCFASSGASGAKHRPALRRHRHGAAAAPLGVEPWLALTLSRTSAKPRRSRCREAKADDLAATQAHERRDRKIAASCRLACARSHRSGSASISRCSLSSSDSKKSASPTAGLLPSGGCHA